MPEKIELMKPTVVIYKGKNPYQTAKKALQKSSLPDLKGKRILIKPNAARLASPGEGVTTHPGVIAAAIDHLREKGANHIVIGESCIFGVDSKEAFRMTGLKEISVKRGVDLIDFDRVDPVEIAIPNGKLLKKIKVPSLLKNFHFIISIQNSPSISRASSSTTKDRAVPAFQPYWSFSKIITHNFLHTDYRTKRFISDSVKI
jgi:uncharacterized protein (DUF362 family)